MKTKTASRRAREAECLALRAERDTYRAALQTIMDGGYAPGADVAHPSIGLARDTLDPQWRERAASHYPKL